ncbi:unnamed protein product [Merluccius merluccius]
MDRAGVALWMLLSIALMRVSDSERRDPTGGRTTTTSTTTTAALVRDQQPRVRSQAHSPKRPENGASSAASDPGPSPGPGPSDSPSESLLDQVSAAAAAAAARRTPENQPRKRSPLGRASPMSVEVSSVALDGP